MYHFYRVNVKVLQNGIKSAERNKAPLFPTFHLKKGFRQKVLSTLVVVELMMGIVVKRN